MSVCVGLVSAHSRADLDRQAVDGHGAAHAKEHEHAAELGASCELVQQDEQHQHHGQPQPLVQRIRPVYVE